jgi:Outer membrane protein
VPNPTFEADLGRGRARIGDESRTESELALSIPFGWIAQRRSRLEAANAEVDLALAESRSSRREVVLQLGTLFWGLAYEQARVGVLETLVAQTSKLAQTVRRRVETGEVRPVEAPLVEIELEKVAGELEAARTLLLGRQTALARWLGVPPGRTLVARADLSALPVVPDREAALASARAADPALRIASARTRLLAADVRAERRATIPSVSLRGFVTDELDRSSRSRHLRRRPDLELERGARRPGRGEARSGQQAGRGDGARGRDDRHRGSGRVPRVRSHREALP